MNEKHLLDRKYTPHTRISIKLNYIKENSNENDLPQELQFPPSHLLSPYKRTKREKKNLKYLDNAERP